MRPSPFPVGAEEIAAAPLVVRQATVEVLRIFDVAAEIDLVRVETLLAGRAPVGRIRLSRVEPKALAFDDPPVVTDLPAPPVEVRGERMETRASARIYSFGVISLSLEVVQPRPMPWDEWETFAREAEREAAALAFWRTGVNGLLDALHTAVQGPTRIRMEEDYAVVTVREMDPAISAAALLETVDLVPVLTHDPRPLSPGARADVLRHRHSYYENDLVVLTWERAFVLEPEADADIAEVLEVANAQLLELRYYDNLLDEELPRIYGQAAAVRRGTAVLRGRYARAANQMRGLVAEVTQITEKVENALKVTEDVYLARIYSSALDLYRVRHWTASIDRKLSLIRDTYTALYDEAVATRAEVLEIAIVLLIVLEIVLAFVVPGH